MIEQIGRLNTAIGSRYAVERELGRGGTATVYLARDLKHQRKVAVKVLHPEFAAAIGVARFLREIEIAAGLSHPHILPLHDSGEANGALFFVMPYVEAGSLQDRLSRERQLSIDEAVRIAREVADALAYAHDRGVIHRDVKPANIMLESGHAMVADFGIALSAPATSPDRLTGTGVLLGTPLYMSPEQAGGSEPLDGRSDIYSLGCVLYEMLSGDPPFVASSAAAILTKKLFEPTPSLQLLRETVSPSLEHVVQRSLARTPADRFRTAVEFASALESVSIDPLGRGAFDAADSSLRANGGRTPAPRRGAPGVVERAAEGAGARPARIALQLLGFAAATVATLALIGLITTTFYDAVMDVPGAYRPSRADFVGVGWKALFPVLVWGSAALVLWAAMRSLVRALRLVRPVRRTLDTVAAKLSEMWAELWGRAHPAAVADLSFVVITVAAIGVVIPVAWVLGAAGPDEPGVFSCAYRSLHNAYSPVMALLVAALGLLWQRAFGRTGRRPVGTLAQVQKWGGLAWILGLVLLLLAPWRVRFQNDHPRATLDGDRVYVLLERGTDRVLYNATRGVTMEYRPGQGPALELLNSVGYVFEDEAAFAGRASESCWSTEGP